MLTENTVELRRIPFLAGLDPQVLSYLHAHLIRQECPAGERLALPGERQDRLVIVESGRVELIGVTGQKQVVGPGGAFGEAMLRYGVPSAFTAQAATPCSLWNLERQDWLVARELAAAGSKAVPARPDASPAPADLPDTQPVSSAKPAPPEVPALPELSTLPEEPASPDLPAPATAPARSRLRPAGCALLALALILVLGLFFSSIGPDLVVMGGSSLSNWALEAQRPDLSTASLRLALRLQPASADLNDALGVLLFSQGQLEAAQAALEQAVALDPELASARNNLGVVLLALDRPDAAIPHLETAETLNPGSVETHINLGNACLAAGDSACAARSYQHAFDLDPTQAQARALWAAIALQHGQTEQARQAWQQAAEIAPDLFLAQRGLGAVAVLEGRPAEALPALQAALAAEPSDPLTRFYLGLALEGLDRSTEAADEFEQVLRLTQDPAVIALAQAHLLELLQQRSPGSGN